MVCVGGTKSTPGQHKRSATNLNLDCRHTPQLRSRAAVREVLNSVLSGSSVVVHRATDSHALTIVDPGLVQDYIAQLGDTDSASRATVCQGAQSTWVMYEIVRDAGATRKVLHRLENGKWLQVVKLVSKAAVLEVVEAALESPANVVSFLGLQVLLGRC